MLVFLLAEPLVDLDFWNNTDTMIAKVNSFLSKTMMSTHTITYYLVE